MTIDSQPFATSTERLASLRSMQNVRPLTLEECKEVIAIMAGDRQRAAATSAKSKSAAKAKGPINSDDLLSQLDGL